MHVKSPAEEGSTLDSPRVFIIDDEQALANTLKQMLAGQGYLVEIFSSAEEFQAREPYGGVGCILLDLVLPGMDGFTLLDALRRSPMTTPIIIMTGEGDIPASVRSIKKGAMDYLAKPFSQPELQRVVAEALAQSRRVQPFISRLNTLSPREREVLESMLHGLLNKQIASRLGISEKTIKIHRGSIMKKLCVPSFPDLVRWWVEIGMTLSPNQANDQTPPSPADPGVDADSPG